MIRSCFKGQKQVLSFPPATKHHRTRKPRRKQFIATRNTRLRKAYVAAYKKSQKGNRLLLTANLANLGEWGKDLINHYSISEV